MNAASYVIDSAQVVATIAVVATFYVQRRQFREQQNVSRGQNAFDLIQYLQQPQHMTSRAAVSELARVPFDQWTAPQRSRADEVCTLWQLAASVSQTGVLPEDFLLRNYGGTILWHWEVCKPYVLDLQARTGAYQRRDFQTLAADIESRSEEARESVAARRAALTPPAPAPAE